MALQVLSNFKNKKRILITPGIVDLGEKLYFASGSDKNIKLTTKDDLELFKAYLKADKDNWLK